MRLSGWGKYPVIDTAVSSPGSDGAAERLLEAATSLIGRGLGRSYGDSALNGTSVLTALRLNALESFDEETGLLVAQAGVTLADIIEAFLPRGWFLPVTPGTKIVTLGGAIASDVHGKNHHQAGTFSRHVEWFDIWTPARGVVRCSPTEHADLFHATAGGQGLTGFILRAALRLERVPSAFIKQTLVKTANLASIMETFEEYAHLPYSVAWIDCLRSGPGMGRSLFTGGFFAQADELPAKHRAAPHQSPAPLALRVPVDFPSFALNSLSVRAFNALYYGKAPAGRTESIVNYNGFFYPLDAIAEWNRIYGKRGFTQYQFVLPKESGGEGLPTILSAIAASGQGSFLAVLKLFGGRSAHAGSLSFPLEGYTLALDFPITERLFPLLDRLDAMVLDHGGRLYLTKDARMSAETFARSYGDAARQFLAVKSAFDPDGVFSSLQSRRLGLTQ